MTATEKQQLTFAVGPPAPVQVCQLQNEFQAVLDLYQEEQPSRLLEIGTAAGGSLYHFLRNSQAGTTIVSVDWQETPADYKPPDQDTLAEWTPTGVRCVLIDGDSHSQETQQETAAFAPYDWCFIDGAHTYEDCAQDFQAYRKQVRPGGLVLLHDISLRRDYGDGTSAGVWRMWREIQASGFWTREFRAHPFLTEYGIGALRV